MGFSLKVFPMGGVHNEYQRPTKKKSVPRADLGLTHRRLLIGNQQQFSALAIGEFAPLSDHLGVARHYLVRF